jgi:hypothetical protein
VPRRCRRSGSTPTPGRWSPPIRRPTVALANGLGAMMLVMAMKLPPMSPAELDLADVARGVGRHDEVIRDGHDAAMEGDDDGL